MKISGLQKEKEARKGVDLSRLIMDVILY